MNKIEIDTLEYNQLKLDSDNLNYKLTHQRMKRDGHTLEELIIKFGKQA